MEYTVEEISPVKRKVIVKITAEEATAALVTTVTLYKSNVDVKGFRKGKVPSSVVESRYKKEIYKEATTDLVNYQLNEILSQLEVTPLSRLEVDSKELVRDEPFEYSFSFEVAPAIDLPEYRGLEVEQEVPEVVESEVDAVIDRIRNSLGELAKVTEERHPEDGDVALISFSSYLDGEPLPEIRADNFELTLGADQALPEFEDLVKGLKATQSGERDIVFPEDFINKKLAGKSVTMKATLHAIKHLNLPEVDDAFAQRAGGFDSVEKLREAITKSYMETRNQLSKSVAQKKLLDSLLSQVEFELPPTMVEEQIDRMVGEVRADLERRGKSLESTGKPLEEIRGEIRPRAEDLVRSQVFLMDVAVKEGMTVAPGEVERFLQELAERTRQDLATVRAFHEENNLMFAVKDKLLADKAMELIYSQAKVSEVPASEMKNHEQEGGK
ncbi:MAG: trigger factor [Thermodesulfobacteriota bacterium]|nr:trigger factor [Thermodesulfobacteriota bacterium]